MRVPLWKKCGCHFCGCHFEKNRNCKMRVPLLRVPLWKKCGCHNVGATLKNAGATFAVVTLRKMRLSLLRLPLWFSQKLIENERNEILKLLNFFKKKRFFQILKIPWKKQLQELFFWKAHSTSKLFRIASNHFQNFLKVSLERFDFTFNDFETLSATI